MKILLIPNFVCALDKMAESMSFNLCRSSLFTNHQFLWKFLCKKAIKSLFYHCHKKRFSLNFTLRYFSCLSLVPQEDFVKAS